MTRRNSPRRKTLRRNRPAPPHASRYRWLRFESLEDRRLLAGDCCGLGEDGPLVSVRLEAADPVTLEPLSTVHQGSEFLLLAYVQDERAQADGVFAAYLDLTYPSTSFSPGSLPEGGSLFYDRDFRNGTSGNASQAGLVDEFGAFSSVSTTAGQNEQLLGGVLLVPTQTGEARFAADPADEQPFHEFLLFNADNAIPSDLISFGDLTLTVQAALPDKLVNARNDSFAVGENSNGHLLDVLANDTDDTGRSLTITSLDTTDTRGQASIANDGSIVIYSPEPGFVGLDRFNYLASAGSDQDTGTVVVEVERSSVGDNLVRFSYEIVNQEGVSVSSVTVGERFVLNVMVEDLRGLPEGVFASYLDVQYTSNAIAVAGPIDFGSAYQNGIGGDVSVAGLIDEVGAFSSVDPLGGGRFMLFSVPFDATDVGRVIFDGNAADALPEGATLLYSRDEPVPPDQIEFGRVSLDVLPGVIAVDDSFHLPVNTTSELAVLDNDVNRRIGSMRVESISTAGLLGNVSIINDGTALSYTPPVNFGGSEQFTYTLRGQSGSDVGTVTIHVDSVSQADDLLSIRLAATDLSGSPIDSVTAGDEFLLQAFVQDMRGDASDRGVFAAYLDVLYEYQHIRPVFDASRPRVEFDGPYVNGISGSSLVPGLLDDIGAFQTNTGPLGVDPQPLFSATFLATSSQGHPDSFDVVEDGRATLDVLTNDLPNEGRVVFRADPSDVVPQADVLLYEPPEPVFFDEIQFIDATLDITAGGDAVITSVGQTTNGGIVTIIDGGDRLLYSPSADFSGVDRFTYSLDGATEIEVAINVLPVNDAPIAVGDMYRGQQGHPLAVSANRGVLANDLDVDGDALRPIVLSDPASGQLVVEESGAFTYTPAASFIGTDSFTYRVTDGVLESDVVTVALEIVPKPVSVRLETVDADGQVTTEFSADQPVGVRVLVQDLRGAEQLFPGLGAAYLDIAYDPTQVAPKLGSENSLGLDVDFGASFGNGHRGEVLPGGRLNDIGAFQSGFDPLGTGEVELLTARFQIGQPRAADDSFSVPQSGQVSLDVLTNDADLRWQVALDAQHANDSPLADVLYFNPAETVPVEDINYGDVTFTARNGDLTIGSVSSSDHGGTVSISGQAIQYAAPTGFIGTDRFTYTAVDARGAVATATVEVEIVQGWQNTINPLDVNQDGEVSPIDALIVVNFVNEHGAIDLTESPVAIEFPIDVNGDGSVSPLDALIIINAIHTSNEPEGEGDSFVPLPTTTRVPTLQAATRLVTSAGGLAQVPDEDPWRVTGTRASDTRTDSVQAVEEVDDDLLSSLAEDIEPLWTL